MSLGSEAVGGSVELARWALEGADAPAIGAGRRVVLIPGLYMGDSSLRPLAGWLERCGFLAVPAGIRCNVGCSEEAMVRLEVRLAELGQCGGTKVVLIGQSRGGCLARVLAVRRPDLVAGVVTLGSPLVDQFAIDPVLRLTLRAVATLGTLGVPGLLRHSCATGECCRAFRRDLAGPFPASVSFTSVYSLADGLVDPAASLDPAATHAEVESTHSGMAVSPATCRVLARVLAPHVASRSSCSRGETALVLPSLPAAATLTR